MYVCDSELKNEVCAKMDIQNIDTDMISPKQFLKTIQRSGEWTFCTIWSAQVYVCIFVFFCLYEVFSKQFYVSD